MQAVQVLKIQHDLEPIKFSGSSKPELKPLFEKRYRDLLGSDFDNYVKYSYSYLNRALRVNTTMISPEELKVRLEKQGWILQQIPWYRAAFWVRHVNGRRDLGNALEHQLGYFYIQEAASMIPPIALDPQPGDAVLDCCASPGSKTTQLAEMIGDKGLVIANDLTGERLAPLGSNVQRLGLTSVLQIQTDFLKIPETMKFDRILLDAPCSGSGTIRKSIKTLITWNPKTLSKIANTQRKMIEKAWVLLKPGGTLVYSTCSTDPEEDEEIVSNFIANHPDAHVVEFDLPGFKRSPSITEFDGKKYSDEVLKTLRVWPQDNDTEGFYVAKIVKKENN